jgi:hypothetical protein
MAGPDILYRLGLHCSDTCHKDWSLDCKPVLNHPRWLLKMEPSVQALLYPDIQTKQQIQELLLPRP